MYNARTGEVFLTDKHVARCGPVPGVVGLATLRLYSPQFDWICKGSAGATSADVKDDQPIVPGGKQSYAVPYPYFVVEDSKGTGVDSRRYDWINWVADIDDPELAVVYSCKNNVAFYPDLVNPGFQFVGET